jgi:hypothetical protein
MMSLDVLCTGSRSTVLVLLVDGRSEALDYLNSLPRNSFIRLQVLLGRLADDQFIANPEKFRRLSAGICELKLRKPPVRLFCFQDGPDWICTHGAVKPGKRELQSHIAKVEALRQRYLKERI